MSVDNRISLNIVRMELQDCQKDAELFGWDISEIDESNHVFTVKMISPIDDEGYKMEIRFDDYKELPLLIEFIDPKTGEKGTKNAYPADGGGKAGNLFHNHPCICHPCSRKAYKGYSNVHANDWNLIGWQQNPKVDTLTNIRAILRAVYFRISNAEIYKGRMHG
jgi:hypothetical protein